ncbi:regulatory protein RecX [Moraxella marmotae]|uniref:regulatory protein RecX n=1 Tax=Moraxella marmotae TaxID=3344520 RepID=UPI0035F24FCE
MSIKTLSEILVEMGESPVSADNYQPQVLDKSNFYQLTTTTPPRFNQLPKRTAKADFGKTGFDKTVQTHQKSDGKSTKQATPTKPFVSHQQNLPNDDALPLSKANRQNPPNTQSSNDNRQTKPITKTAPRLPQRSTQQNAQSRQSMPIKALLDDAKQGNATAAMPEKLAERLKDVAIEPLITADRATNYLRWLAFYYLSHRELSRHELRQKLLAKGCDETAVDALIVEFAQKGYQSDERCAAMLIRESIRKGRGKIHIKQRLKHAQIQLDGDASLDALIADANINTLTDGTVLSGDCDEIDWLKLAVEARTRKYGEMPPTTPKDKARQMRFLQYRGFGLSVCLDALKYRLSDLD